jgi:hypothetical protein
VEKGDKVRVTRWRAGRAARALPTGRARVLRLHPDDDGR